jgi:hypothetical protein
VRLGLKRASGAVAASGAGGEPVECLEDFRGAPQLVALLVGELDEHAGGDERSMARYVFGRAMPSSPARNLALTTRRRTMTSAARQALAPRRARRTVLAVAADTAEVVEQFAAVGHRGERGGRDPLDDQDRVTLAVGGEGSSGRARRRLPPPWAGPSAPGGPGWPCWPWSGLTPPGANREPTDCSPNRLADHRVPHQPALLPRTWPQLGVTSKVCMPTRSPSIACTASDNRSRT